ncbi:hypothetical protein [Sphaerisporangium perillae]|uniref:hypothetical protein n=1 Tax=Sphaerisporangium perillae TaxID=2935860 RepID=UPI00200F0FAF|nr:hypothetical protein [Sphaerisporangium perillae]
MGDRYYSTSAAFLEALAEAGIRERPDNGVITPQYLTACVRDALAGEDALFLTKAITNFPVVAEHLRANRPGSLIGSGGGSCTSRSAVVAAHLPGV